MILYVEGVDGSGKSTLINNLINVIDVMYPDIVYIKDANKILQTNPYKPDRVTTHQAEVIFRSMMDSELLYILDRGIISDIIYRLFDDYYPVLDLSTAIRFITSSTKVFLIYCDTPNSEQYMLQRGDDNPIAIEKHNLIKKAFREIIPLFNYNCLYDFEEKRSDEKLIEILSKWLKEKYNG